VSLEASAAGLEAGVRRRRGAGVEWQLAEVEGTLYQ